MDPAQYYANTIVNAAKNLGPIFLYVIVGYLVFIKLPFMFMVRVNKENKPKEQEPERPHRPEVKVERPQPEVKVKLQALPDDLAEEREKKKAKEREEEKLRQEKKRLERESARMDEEKKKKKAEAAHAPESTLSPAARLFKFTAGEEITQKELKKRYRELLKQFHPDTVNTLGEEYRAIAERKTKEINTAYDELKKKAS